MQAFQVRTDVEADYHKVFAGFTEELFLSLQPPGARLELLRFDGCRQGDIVSLRVHVLGLAMDWTSAVTEAHKSDAEIYFVDVGTQLPFFLKTWKHRHRIVRLDPGTTIIDDIAFTCPVPGLALLLWPVLRFQFAARRSVYRRVFALDT